LLSPINNLTIAKWAPLLPVQMPRRVGDFGIAPKAVGYGFRLLTSMEIDCGNIYMIRTRSSLDLDKIDYIAVSY
jgi:hypothetical protein